MVRFTPEELRKMMDMQENIRNMSVIAHVDHGKTTLTDNLVASAGIIAESKAGEVTYTMTRKDELNRGITIKSTAISMFFQAPAAVALPAGAQGRGFLVNLIDSPGHVDFSSEVTAALRVTDGALVVVDTVDGVCVQTETVLRQALEERIKPVLVVNKLDRALLELRLDAEAIYQKLAQAVESVNVVIGTYQDGAAGPWEVDPVAGSVAFGSGKLGWFFTLGKFAALWAGRFGVDAARMRERLWGDNYYDPAAKKWKTSNIADDGSVLPRAFCQFVLEPVARLARAVEAEDHATVDSILASQKIVLSADERGQAPKKKLKTVFRRWLPATDVLMEMMVTHLPSPRAAQRYRAALLYTGPEDDRYATAIRECDAAGPLVVFVSKMVPAADRGRFYAVGRVLAGTVRSNHKVLVLGATHVPGGAADARAATVQRPVLLQGRTTELLGDCPCGNIIGLSGVDHCVVKSGTLVDQGAADAFPIKPMKFSVSPVVRVAVAPRNAADLPKLVEGLKRLENSDPLCQCSVSETGEHIVACCGELHLEICIKDLREEFCAADLKVSDPVVSYRETVTAAGTLPVLAKSSNKLNRCITTAAPLAPGLAEALESGEIDTLGDAKVRARALADGFGWDAGEARRIWAFGPDVRGTNCIVDSTKAIMYLQEGRDSLVAGFHTALREGPLCAEPVRGLRIDLVDAVIHHDPAHRGVAQVLPAARRSINGAILTAQPRLLEPVFLVEIVCPEQSIGGVYSTMNKRRGRIIADERREGTPLHQLKCHLPVAESFGFNESLRADTSGQAFPQCFFDHWAQVPGDPLDPSTLAGATVRMIRKRKGLQEEVPDLSRFMDKL